MTGRGQDRPVRRGGKRPPAESAWRQEAEDEGVNQQRHALAVDIQAHVDGGVMPAGLVEHLASCPACEVVAETMRRTAPPESPAVGTLEALAAAAAAAPPALVSALAAEPPEPSPGQVWQVLWDANVVVGLLAGVGDRTVTMWPSTLDMEIADASALVFDGRHTALGVRFACWPAHATEVGSFALSRCLAALGDVDVSELADGWRGGDVLPAGWSRGPDRSLDDPCWRASAELADIAAGIAAASWREPAWEADGAESFAGMLTERGLTPTWLAETLGVPPRHAIAVWRGSRELTADEQDRLSQALGGASAPARRPDPAVLNALDRPALRGLIRAVADAEGVDEATVRRSFVGFRAAARQLDERDRRDVVAQVRLELARRVDAASAGGRW